jgi:transposase
VTLSVTGEASEFLEQIKQLLITSQNEAVLALFNALATERDDLATERDEQALVIQQQVSEIARLRGLHYGRRSEKLTHEELGQLVICFGASAADAAVSEPLLPVPPLSDVEPEEAPLGDKPKVKRPEHNGRGKLSLNVERIVNKVLVPEGERACQACGAEMEAFGHIDHERVEHIPARIVVHVESREKLGCKHCKCDAVTAERENKPDIPLRVGPSFLAYLIESKCDDALPIHRQCDQFARLGFELPVSTAYGYWSYVTSLLLPVSTALLGVVLEDPNWVGVDDTRLDVLDRTHKGGKYRGHLWCFRASSGLVAYQFTESWRAAEIAPWFYAIGEGTHIQVDDYKGYNKKFTNTKGEWLAIVPPSRRLACMMHVRRRFRAAFKAGDKRAAVVVQWIADIYKIEAQARGMPSAERMALRQTHSLPLLDCFDAWVDEQEPKLGKTSKLAKAVLYAKQQRIYIRRCFSDGRFEIDNGAVERAIREPAIGRKNFLFTGSAVAGQRLAGAYSLVQTCRALGISTRDYLIDVITKLERGWPARRLTELLPQRWAAQRPV